MATKKVTNELLAQKLDFMSERLADYHTELKMHIAEDKELLETKIMPLIYMKNKLYAIATALGVVMTFLGWDYLRRLFVVEVIK